MIGQLAQKGLLKEEIQVIAEKRIMEMEEQLELMVTDERTPKIYSVLN